MNDNPAPRQDDAPPGANPRVRARMSRMRHWVETWRWGRREWLLSLILAPLALALGAYGSERYRLRERVLPEVYILGSAVAGFDRTALDAYLTERSEQLGQRPLRVQVAERTFELHARELGLRIEVESTAQRALAQGRTGSLPERVVWRLRRWQTPQESPVEVSIDGAKLDALLDTWQREALVEPIEGDVLLADGKLSARWPQAGARLQRELGKQMLREWFVAGSGPVSLPTTSHAPRLDRQAVETALRRAHELTDKALTLKLPAILPRGANEDSDASGALTSPATSTSTGASKFNPKPKSQTKPNNAEDAAAPAQSELRFSPKLLKEALATTLSTQEPPKLELNFSLSGLQQYLDESRAKVEIEPRDASFNIDFRQRIRIEPSRLGTRIEADRLPERLLAAATSPDRTAELPMLSGVKPKLLTADAEALGITELVSRFTTHHPCCRPRVENIHHIADLLNDTIVAPGETFSVNETLGQRTLQSGFLEAPTIVHGEMKDTVGGGISQFATTLFNAVLEGGYEIIERQPHSYYFPRYPVGHEATLSFPKPDLIFKNDTKAGLLIKTSYSGTFIRVSLYGNKEGRKVRRKVSKRFDVVEPPVRYEADDELDPEKEKVLERGQIGWSVIVSRIITYPEGQPAEQTRKVTYSPRERVVAVHSCRIPEGEPGHTGEECPEPEPIECEDGDEECLKLQAEQEARAADGEQGRGGSGATDGERDWGLVDD